MGLAASKESFEKIEIFKKQQINARSLGWIMSASDKAPRPVQVDILHKCLEGLGIPRFWPKDFEMRQLQIR